MRFLFFDIYNFITSGLQSSTCAKHTEVSVDTPACIDVYTYTCMRSVRKVKRDVCRSRRNLPSRHYRIYRDTSWNTPMFDLAFELRRNFHRKSPPSEGPTLTARLAEEVEDRRGTTCSSYRTYHPCNDDGPRPTCTDGIDCLSIFTHLPRHKAVCERRSPLVKRMSRAASGILGVYVQTNRLANSPNNRCLFCFRLKSKKIIHNFRPINSLSKNHFQLQFKIYFISIDIDISIYVDKKWDERYFFWGKDI